MNNKKHTQTTATKALLQGYPSFQPIATHAEATKAFIDSQPKSKASDGKNTCLAEFLSVMKFIVENMRTFTVSDALQLSRGKDLSAVEVQSLFCLWSDKMIADGRLKRISGAYDADVFQVV